MLAVHPQLFKIDAVEVILVEVAFYVLAVCGCVVLVFLLKRKFHSVAEKYHAESVWTTNPAEATYGYGFPGEEFTKAQKDAIYERDGFKCKVCGCRVVNGMINTDSERWKAAVWRAKNGHIDHYPIPFKDGGKARLDNGRVTCSECNIRKSDDLDLKAVEEYCRFGVDENGKRFRRDKVEKFLKPKRGHVWSRRAGRNRQVVAT